MHLPPVPPQSEAPHSGVMVALVVPGLRKKVPM